MKKMNYKIIKLKKNILIVLVLGLVSCSKDDNTVTPTNPQGQSCNFSTLAATSSENYAFDANFSNFFTQSSRWESHNADISLVAGKGQLTANSANTSSALEAWKLYKTQMPYNKSWEISVAAKVPLYWNTNGGTNAQVGAGIYAGKPVASGQSSKVYECNLAVINGGERFVQAQLIANRLGGDPIDVQRTVLASTKETVTLKIQFCTTTKTLSLFIDNTIVGVGRKIDASGLDNWALGANDKIDIGIMGFAENTVITSNQPTIDDFSVKIY